MSRARPFHGSALRALSLAAALLVCGAASAQEDSDVPPAERPNAMGGAARGVDFPLPEGWTRADPGSGRSIYRFVHSTTSSVVEVKGAFVSPTATDAFYTGFRDVFVKDRRFTAVTTGTLVAIGGATGVLDTYTFDPNPRDPSTAEQPLKAEEATTDPAQATGEDASEATDEAEEDQFVLAVHTFVFYTKTNNTVWTVIYYGRPKLAPAEKTIYQRITTVFCPKACKGSSPLEPEPGAPRKPVEVKVKVKAVEPTQGQ